MCFTTENWDKTTKPEVLEKNTLARLRYFIESKHELLLYQQWPENLPDMLEKHSETPILGV